MARVEQPLVTRSWTTEETKLPFLQGSYSVIAKQSQTLRDPLGDLWGVDVHCYRRRDAAGGCTFGLQTLEVHGGPCGGPALWRSSNGPGAGVAGNLLVVADPPYPHRDIVSICGQQTTDK
jgi:hypothetical protein